MSCTSFPRPTTTSKLNLSPFTPCWPELGWCHAGPHLRRNRSRCRHPVHVIKDRTRLVALNIIYIIKIIYIYIHAFTNSDYSPSFLPPWAGVFFRIHRYTMVHHTIMEFDQPLGIYLIDGPLWTIRGRSGTVTHCNRKLLTRIEATNANRLTLLGELTLIPCAASGTSRKTSMKSNIEWFWLGVFI
jgi:hypothetical protein